jgi:hypothetical protein
MDAVKEFSNTYCSVLGTSSMLKAATFPPIRFLRAATAKP